MASKTLIGCGLAQPVCQWIVSLVSVQLCRCWATEAFESNLSDRKLNIIDCHCFEKKYVKKSSDIKKNVERIAF